MDHARWVLANGADGVTVFGTTGEGAGIGLSERYAVLGAAHAAGLDMSRQVVAGVTASTVEDCVHQARAAYEAGCRAILITPPFFFPSMPEEGLFRFFCTVFDRLGGSLRDVLLYHIPAMTGSIITAALLGRLRQRYGAAIIGVKDSSGDWDSTQAFLDDHRDIQVLVGSERHCARAVRAGGGGAICGLANIRPDILRAAAWHGEEVALIDAYRSAILPDPFPASLKAAIAQRTKLPGWGRMRPPNLPLDPARAAALLQRLDQVVTERVAA